MNEGWICKICGRSYGPSETECRVCNLRIREKEENQKHKNSEPDTLETNPPDRLRVDVWRPTPEQNEELRKIKAIWGVHEGLMI